MKRSAGHFIKQLCLLVLFIPFCLIPITTQAQTREEEIESRTIPASYTARPDTGFVAVYEFSPGMIVMTFEAHEAEQNTLTRFDSIFNELCQTDSLNLAIDDYSDGAESRYPRRNDLKLLDTTGIYTIWQSPHLEMRLKKYIAQYYYIYGTKGFMRCKIRDVVFNSGSCNAFYGLRVEGYDKSKCGHPLFSYPKLLPIHYGGNYTKLQKALDQETDERIKDSTDNYKNYIHSKVYADIDGALLAYCDDFTWSHKLNNSKTLFPERMIYAASASKKGLLSWFSQFDAFGVPCD